MHDKRLHFLSHITIRKPKKKRKLTNVSKLNVKNGSVAPLKRPHSINNLVKSSCFQEQLFFMENPH